MYNGICITIVIAQFHFLESPSLVQLCCTLHVHLNDDGPWAILIFESPMHDSVNNHCNLCDTSAFNLAASNVARCWDGANVTEVSQSPANERWPRLYNVMEYHTCCWTFSTVGFACIYPWFSCHNAPSLHLYLFCVNPFYSLCFCTSMKCELVGIKPTATIPTSTALYCLCALVTA